MSSMSSIEACGAPQPGTAAGYGWHGTHGGAFNACDPCKAAAAKERRERRQRRLESDPSYRYRINARHNAYLRERRQRDPEWRERWNDFMALRLLLG